MKRPRPRPSRSTPIVVRSTSYRPLNLRSASGENSPKAALRQAQGDRLRIPTSVGKRGQATFLAHHEGTLKATTDGTLCLILPLPPSINHQYATVHGRRVLSSAGRRFKTQVGQEVLCVLAARRSGPPLTETLNGAPLALDLRFYFSSGLRRDIDGGLKITQDAVCEALGINDNRIIEVILRKDIDAEAPRMELSLRRVPPPLPRGVSSSLR